MENTVSNISEISREIDALDRAHEFRAYRELGFPTEEIAEMSRYPTDVVAVILANPGCELVQ